MTEYIYTNRRLIIMIIKQMVMTSFVLMNRLIDNVCRKAYSRNTIEKTFER